MKKVNIFLMSILAICCAFVMMSPKSYQSSYAIGNDFQGVFVSPAVTFMPKYTSGAQVDYNSSNYNVWYFQYRLEQSVSGLVYSYNNNTIYLSAPRSTDGNIAYNNYTFSSTAGVLGQSFVIDSSYVYNDAVSQFAFWFELSDTAISGRVVSLSISYAPCYENGQVVSRVPSSIDNSTNQLMYAYMMIHTIQYEYGYVRILYLTFDSYPTDTTYVFDSSMQDSQYYQNGYNNGYSSGRQDGYNAGNSEGYDYGYQVGYNAGHTDGVADSNDYSFIGLMGSVIDAPVSAVRGLLNFNVLGVDISAFVFGLFTITIILVIIKKVKGM